MWYYLATDQQQQGPVDEARFRELASTGTITPQTLVWKEGMSAWQPYETLAGAGSLVVAPAAPAAIDAAACHMCGKVVGSDNLIELGGFLTCAECKPKVVQALSEGGQLAAAAVWSDGKKVVAMDGAHFPARCVKCNQATSEPALKRKLYWHNPLLYVLIFIQFIIYVIVAVLVRKRATVDIHLCREHLDRRRNFMIGVWVSLGLGLAGMISGIAGNQGFVTLAGVVLILVAFVLGIMARPMATVKIKDKTVWLKGAGKDFLASLPQWKG